MKCPHCLESFHRQLTQNRLGKDMDWAYYDVNFQNCPSCSRFIINLQTTASAGRTATRIVYPKAIARKAFSKTDVPDKFLEDYTEACLVLSDSPKASAALSRRCLQHILREKAGVKHQDLSKEIDDVLASRQLPTHLAAAVDAIRSIGNFAAHPIKSTSSGAIVDVEYGEAEWSLDVVEGLFDFYFVQPAETQRKKDAFNKKLADARKPPIK